jgi:hypothetical protein
MVIYGMFVQKSVNNVLLFFLYINDYLTIIIDIFTWQPFVMSLEKNPPLLCLDMQNNFWFFFFNVSTNL